MDIDLAESTKHVQGSKGDHQIGEGKDILGIGLKLDLAFANPHTDTVRLGRSHGEDRPGEEADEEANRGNHGAQSRLGLVVAADGRRSGDGADRGTEDRGDDVDGGGDEEDASLVVDKHFVGTIIAGFGNGIEIADVGVEREDKEDKDALDEDKGRISAIFDQGREIESLGEAQAPVNGGEAKRDVVRKGTIGSNDEIETLIDDNGRRGSANKAGHVEEDATSPHEADKRSEETEGRLADMEDLHADEGNGGDDHEKEVETLEIHRANGGDDVVGDEAGLRKGLDHREEADADGKGLPDGKGKNGSQLLSKRRDDDSKGKDGREEGDCHHVRIGQTGIGGDHRDQRRGEREIAALHDGTIEENAKKQGAKEADKRDGKIASGIASIDFANDLRVHQEGGNGNEETADTGSDFAADGRTALIDMEEGTDGLGNLAGFPRLYDNGVFGCGHFTLPPFSKGLPLFPCGQWGGR